MAIAIAKEIQELPTSPAAADEPPELVAVREPTVRAIALVKASAKKRPKPATIKVSTIVVVSYFFEAMIELDIFFLTVDKFFKSARDFAKKFLLGRNTSIDTSFDFQAMLKFRPHLRLSTTTYQ